MTSMDFTSSEAKKDDGGRGRGTPTSSQGRDQSSNFLSGSELESYLWSLVVFPSSSTKEATTVENLLSGEQKTGNSSNEASSSRHNESTSPHEAVLRQDIPRSNLLLHSRSELVELYLVNKRKFEKSLLGTNTTSDKVNPPEYDSGTKTGSCDKVSVACQVQPSHQARLSYDEDIPSDVITFSDSEFKVYCTPLSSILSSTKGTTTDESLGKKTSNETSIRQYKDITSDVINTHSRSEAKAYIKSLAFPSTKATTDESLRKKTSNETSIRQYKDISSDMINTRSRSEREAYLKSLVFPSTKATADESLGTKTVNNDETSIRYVPYEDNFSDLIMFSRSEFEAHFSSMFASWKESHGGLDNNSSAASASTSNFATSSNNGPNAATAAGKSH